MVGPKIHVFNKFSKQFYSHQNLGLTLQDHAQIDRPKSPFSFFCKIKDTFFIFTNKFIEMDIVIISAISYVI